MPVFERAHQIGINGSQFYDIAGDFHVYQSPPDGERLTANQTQTLKRIDAPNYESDFRSADRRRHEGTCEWLWGRPEFASWMVFGWTSLLVIFGIAGAGKTILASWLIKQSRLSPPLHMCIYHFFKDTDDNKNTPLAATRSLLDQVYKNIRHTEYASALESRLEAQTENTHWPVEFEPLWDILYDTLRSFVQSSQPSSRIPRVTIILDALDECKHSKQLVRSLRRLVHGAVDMIQVVVTSRRSGDHVDDLILPYPDQCPVTFLNISQDDVQQDIASFINYKISNIPRLRLTEHEPLRRNIIAEFSSIHHHQGMFLWAHLMCKELKKLQTIKEIWDLLEDMPTGLEAMYERICGRLLKNSSRYREFGHVVLQWVFVSNRPITLIELKEALRTMLNGAADAQSMSWDDELIWSREDVVKSCGDLVRYPDKGDLIIPLHLSAQQFFCTPTPELSRKHPNISIDAIRPFLVDVPRTEFMIATTCLKYMLSTSPHSAQYLSPVTTLKPGGCRTSEQDEFRKLYPLLDYSVLHWPECLLKRLEAQNEPGSNDLQLLLVIVVEFTHSPTWLVWLEEFIRLTYVEFVQNIIRRIIALNHPLIPSELSSWFKRVMKILLDFSVALSNPQLVKLAAMQKQRWPLGSEVHHEHFPPLDSRTGQWIHYDPITDCLFSFDGWANLRCQVMKTGLRQRPLSVLGSQHTYFKSAAISNRSDFIAVIHRRMLPPPELYAVYITCWRINLTNTVLGSSDWADVVFHRSFDVGRSQTVSDVFDLTFNDKDALVTPHGVFNMETQECIIQPTVIHHSIRKTVCFNSLGNHLVRFRYPILEVAKVDGSPVGQLKIFGSLEVACLSNSGTKLVVYAKGMTPNLFCFLVNEGKEIDMPLDASWKPYCTNAQFTEDEGKFIAPVRHFLYEGGYHYAVGVWTFSEGRNVHVAIAHMSLRSFVFCLVPKTPTGSNPDMLIVNDVGTITRQGIHSLSLVQQSSNRDLRDTYSVIVDTGTVLKLVIWSRLRVTKFPNDVFRIQVWSIKTHQLLSQNEVLVPTRDSTTECRYHSLSPRGDRLLVGTHILEARSSPIGDFYFGICTLPVPEDDGDEDSRSGEFSMDGTRLAWSCNIGGIPTLYLLEIVEGPRIIRQASLTFPPEAGDIMTVFSRHDPDLLIADDCVYRFEDEHLTFLTRIPGFENDIIEGFSACGSYCYADGQDGPMIRPLWEDVAVTDFIPPISLQAWGGSYVSLPYVVSLLRRGDALCLETEFIHNVGETYPEARLSRPIYVFPGWLQPPEVNPDSYLVWPDEDGANFQLIILLDGVPEFSDAGFTWDELTKDD